MSRPRSLIPFIIPGVAVLLLGIFLAVGMSRKVPGNSPTDRTTGTDPREADAQDAPPASVHDLSVTPGSPSAAAGQFPAPEHPFVLGQVQRKMEPALRVLGRDFEVEAFSELEFPLFDGDSVDLTDLRHTRIDERSGVFTGRVEGDAFSHVVLSYVGRAESGTIHRPATGEYFDLRTAGEAGAVILSRINPNSIPPCAACLPGEAHSVH